MSAIAKTMVLLLVCLNTLLFAQEASIIKVVDSENVEINLGESHDVKVGDKFTVYGKGKFLHPATGQMVDADNVAIGEIEIIETMANTSMARIVTSNQTILINARLEKKTSKEVDQPTQPTQPTSDYYQVGYTSKTKTSDPVKHQKNYFAIDKCNWPENDSVFFEHGKRKRLKKNDLLLLELSDKESYLGYVKVNKQGRNSSNGQLKLFNQNQASFQNKLEELSFMNYSPFDLQVGVGFNIYLNQIPFSFRLDVDWYPNKGIKSVQQYNDWFWIGLDINGDFFNEISFNIPDYVVLSDYSEGSRLSLSFEVGFSPWRNQVTGAKRFNFGISQKFLRNVAENYYSDEFYGIKKHYPLAFISYDFKLVSIRHIFGFFKLMVYESIDYGDSYDLSYYPHPFTGFFISIKLPGLGKKLNSKFVD